MKLAQHHLWVGLAAVAVASLTAWVVHRTEWLDTQVPTPLSEELQRDGSRMARQFLHGLGLKAVRAEDLTTLPPPGATLVLSSRYWNLIDGTEARLRDWVRAGGHLVVDGMSLENEPDSEWFPIQRDEPEQEDRKDDKNREPFACRVLKQRDGLMPAWGDGTGFVACLHGHAGLRSTAAPTWVLESEANGVEALRVAQGRGRITALAGGFNFEAQSAAVQLPVEGGVFRVQDFSNRGVVEGDNAVLLAALVDARPGAEVWFVSRIERASLPVWLWRHAAPVLLLAAAALVLALWRGGTRFGPLQAEAPPARRSLSAQIRGTADFLFRHQSSALHTMALRALDETAARQLPAWRRLAHDARAAALAQATQLPEAALATALDPAAQRHAAAHGNALALLETARRALLARSAAGHTSRSTDPRTPSPR